MSTEKKNLIKRRDEKNDREEEKRAVFRELWDKIDTLTWVTGFQKSEI